MSRYNKIHRILDIFYMGLNDKYFSTQELSYKYNVSKKTVSRDINEIRSFLSEYRDIIGNAEIVYDRKKQKYHMVYYDYSRQQYISVLNYKENNSFLYLLSFFQHAYHSFYGINSFDFLRRHISF